MRAIFSASEDSVDSFKNPFEGEFLGEPFMNFAEKVYGKLRERAASFPEAGKLVDRMEKVSLYAQRLTAWKESAEAKAGGQ